MASATMAGGARLFERIRMEAEPLEPDLRCYHHPDRQATAQCDRCGDYLCEACFHEHKDLHVCPRCLKEVTAGRLSLPLRCSP